MEQTVKYVKYTKGIGKMAKAVLWVDYMGRRCLWVFFPCLFYRFVNAYITLRTVFIYILQILCSILFNFPYHKLCLCRLCPIKHCKNESDLRCVMSWMTSSFMLPETSWDPNSRACFLCISSHSGISSVSFSSQSLTNS